MLAGAAPAAANGYCGADPTGVTACPINANGTVSGSISSGSEQDYYVFYAARKTDLQLTVTDTEDPRCSTDFSYMCAWTTAELIDSRGDQLAHTEFSEPSNGVTVPVSVTKSIGRGVYYVAVSGYQSAGTLPSVPYQLTVDGNPGVQWPPACIVPRVRSHMSL